MCYGHASCVTTRPILKWPNRDRFVLSGGHGSMLLYSLLHLTGVRRVDQRLSNFGSWAASRPAILNMVTPGVEVTTGPLGQGFANAVGMALGEAFLAETFNRPSYQVMDHFTYVTMGDGDMQEGISHEAASLAGHLKLGKLICFYDDNNISIDGPTSLSYSDDVPMRFAAYHWHVQEVDGYDMPAIARAIGQAQLITEQPSLIICHTHIGYGSPNKQDTAEAHGSPLGEDEIRLTKEALGLPADEKFWAPADVLARYRNALASGRACQEEWEAAFAAYQQEYPELAATFTEAWAGELPPGWDTELPTWQPGTKVATRAASGKVLDAIAPRIPTLDRWLSRPDTFEQYPPKGSNRCAARGFCGALCPFRNP